VGKVATYKDVCVAIGEGSPRSGECIVTSLESFFLTLLSEPVGAALRSNPFAPYIPCHRVIASNLYVGGFQGEWGQSKTGTKCSLKMEMLAKEGVGFNEDGFVIGKDVVWRG
jgi:methylated-DNA-[protein]-cysteine S-methyltransferase